jgi:hypothetical protein
MNPTQICVQLLIDNFVLEISVLEKFCVENILCWNGVAMGDKKFSIKAEMITLLNMPIEKS